MDPAGNRPSLPFLHCLLVVLVSGLVVTIGVAVPHLRPLPVSKAFGIFLTSCILGFFLISCGDILWRAVRVLMAGNKNGGGAGRPALLGGGALVVALAVLFVGQTVFRRQIAALAPGAVEQAARKAHDLSAWFLESEKNRLDQIAQLSAQPAGNLDTPQGHEAMVMRAIGIGADAAWTLDADGKVNTGRGLLRGTAAGTGVTLQTVPLLPEKRRDLANGLELWDVDGRNLLARRAAAGKGAIAVARRVDGELPGALDTIAAATDELSIERESFARPQANWLLLLQLAVVLLVLLNVSHPQSRWPGLAALDPLSDDGDEELEDFAE